DRLYNCCPSWLNGHSSGEYASGQDIFEMWNSPDSQALRSSMFDGSFAYCNGTLCPVMQDLSNLDDIDDIVAGKRGKKLQEIYKDRQLTVGPPDHINLCYDLSCNLSCPSCRTELIMVRQDHPKYTAKRRLQEKVLEFVHATDHPIRISMTGSGDPFA